MCRTARKKLEGLEDFHFHMLRHTYTSNLLSNGAAPKDVQELLGHTDVSTTMNIYAHATREAKRTSARLLDSSTRYKYQKYHQLDIRNNCYCKRDTAVRYLYSALRSA